MAWNLSSRLGAVLLIVLLLAGCTKDAPIDIQYQTVEKPIMVPCDPGTIEEPADLVQGLKTSDNLFYKVKHILADREQKEGYTTKLKAALDKCKPSK